MATCSTLGGERGLSSLRETRFVGATSSSDRSVDVEGEYIWSEDGWDEGRIRCVDFGSIANGSRTLDRAPGVALEGSNRS